MDQDRGARLTASVPAAPASPAAPATRPFARAFPAEAARDERVIAPARGLPAGRVVVRERFATAAAGRGKAWLDVLWIEAETALATFVHDLATGATTHDPDGPQSRFSDPLLASYQASLAAEPAWPDALAAHHAAWFAIIDDPAHRAHAALTGPDAAPAEQVILDPAANPPLLRAQKRVGPNAPCPCGSGQKYKRCHGSQF